MRTTATVHSVVRDLNAALAADPIAITRLFLHREGCNMAVRRSGVETASPMPGRYDMGALGVIQSFFRAGPVDAYGPIAMDLDHAGGQTKIVRFRVADGVGEEPAPEPVAPLETIHRREARPAGISATGAKQRRGR